MNKFQFNPPTGLLDTSAYPTNPATEAEARGQIQDPLNQIKDYLNLSVDEFVLDRNTNGYTKFTNGLILQWGIVTTETPLSNSFSSIQKNITFPIAFPSNAVAIFANVTNNVTKNDASYLGSCLVNARINDTRRATLEFKIVSSLDRDYEFEGKWLAIGY